MGLISPGGENLLDFLELRQVLSTYDGDLIDPLGWPQERPVPLRVARGPLEGLLGFHSRRCWGLKPCVESVPEPEDSSPVLTWIWGTFGVSRGESVLVSNWGIHVRFPLELGGRNGSPLDVGGTLVLPLEWRRVRRGTFFFAARV